jgi:hypothetical protein
VILWFIVGIIVWILCGLFMLAILKGVYGKSKYMAINKNNIRSMVDIQNIEGSTKKEVKKETFKVRDREVCVESRVISTLGFDGIMPKTERRGNPKRKPHNENPYGSYKKGKGRLKRQNHE